MIKFGVFTDVHYARNVMSGKRNCGISLQRLENIAEDFNARNLDFCICLGDVINSVQDFDTDKQNIEAVSDMFEKFNMPTHIILGNHDLEAMSKTEYYNIFGKGQKKSYYSFSYENTKFIVLDANFNADDSDYCRANYNWVDSYINREQLVWLESELNTCNDERIIIFTHQNLAFRLHNDKVDACVVKNYMEVDRILEKANKKITVIQGHYHDGDYQLINGIEYITLKALCVGNDTSYIPRAIFSVTEELSGIYPE